MLILTLSDDKGKDSVYLLPLYFKNSKMSDVVCYT